MSNGMLATMGSIVGGLVLVVTALNLAYGDGSMLANRIVVIFIASALGISVAAAAVVAAISRHA